MLREAGYRYKIIFIRYFNKTMNITSIGTNYITARQAQKVSFGDVPLIKDKIHIK